MEFFYHGSYHPDGNGGVERVNHTMAQMLAMVVNELRNNWDEQPPHVEFAYNNSVSAATGFGSQRGSHRSAATPPPHNFSERDGVTVHQSLARDHLAYCDSATDRQHRAYAIVREHYALTVARVNRRNPALFDALRSVPKSAVGSWAWMYNTAAIIRQGAKPDTGARVLKAKLNWTSPYKILAVGPCSSADSPNGSPL